MLYRVLSRANKFRTPWRDDFIFSRRSNFLVGLVVVVDLEFFLPPLLRAAKRSLELNISMKLMGVVFLVFLLEEVVDSVAATLAVIVNMVVVVVVPCCVV